MEKINTLFKLPQAATDINKKIVTNNLEKLKRSGLSASLNNYKCWENATFRKQNYTNAVLTTFMQHTVAEHSGTVLVLRHLKTI